MCSVPSEIIPGAGQENTDSQGGGFFLPPFLIAAVDTEVLLCYHDKNKQMFDNIWITEAARGAV